MSQKFEDLSALIDGEVSSSHDAISAVKGDTELMQKWNNYHLIRDGLRKELPPTLNFDIAANVAKALENEPVILSPKKTWRDLPVVASVVPFAKQGGQMAIAASVAVAMILGVQQMNQTEVEQPFNAAPPILGIQGGLSPVSFEQARSVPQKTDTAEQKRRVQAFLIDHKQQMRFKTFQAPVTSTNIEGVEKHEGKASDFVEDSPE